MSLLIEKLKARLADQITLEDMAQAFVQAREELTRHENESLRFVAGAPDELVGPERQSAQAAYHAYRELIAEGERGIRDGATLNGVMERLSATGEQLGLALAGLREIGWAARGPSSHPGANELLALLEGLARGREELEDDLELALERELERADHQAEALAKLPDFVREAQEESLRTYKEWLSGVIEAPDEDPRDWDAMIEELEQWATDYSTFDLDHLLRRYSSVPTGIPCVNFALNCQRLELEELISEDMVDYAIEQALSTLKEGQDRFLASSSLDDVDRQRHQELVKELCNALDGLPEADETAALQEVGGGMVRSVGELMAIHQRVEAAQAGSRMDYRDEAE
jgi:hypothetical protein